MNHPWIRIVLAISVLSVCFSSAEAQLYNDVTESPKSQKLEIKMSPYSPEIGAGKSAYDAVFGDESMFVVKLAYDYEVYQGVGVITLGGEIGYGTISGKGLDPSTGEQTSDDTRLQLIPMAVNLGYHFDYLMTEYDVPLVPYVEGGMDYVIWIITNGSGGLSRVGDGRSDGGTFGVHVSAGLKFQLDSLSKRMASEFDADAGVNNTYLFAEYNYGWINDFGDSDSFSWGGHNVFFGLEFEF
ncbi:MAG: MXAN_2562 family outer membrane beta-barrel protein [Myxococcota bacterium]|nr:MXAN_2562 family outer membrane beta-barrel protein [Myxococcota bacterium]